MVVFNNSYPNLSEQKICEAYDSKYTGMRMTLPSDPQKRQEILAEFRRALLTTYPEEQCDQIIAKAENAGYISEIQRRFGLHYHAADMLTPEVLEGLASQGIYPCYGLMEQ